MGLWRLDIGFRYCTLLAPLSDCLSCRTILVLIRTYWICRVVVRISRALVTPDSLYLAPVVRVGELRVDGRGKLSALQRARGTRKSE